MLFLPVAVVAAAVVVGGGDLHPKKGAAGAQKKNKKEKGERIIHVLTNLQYYFSKLLFTINAS
jgi:hypothetical protein